MRRLALAAAVCCLLAAPPDAVAWGDRTHPAIVRLAIETLPDDAAARFRARRQRLERLSNEPDDVLRARLGRVEAIRHFIDLDGYMPPPFTGFPRTRDAAVAMLGARKVEKYGVLPWEILRMSDELRDALAADDGDWVRIAGHLAHYVGDAYQPLHLTVDYDGQKSGAKGIHRRYENDVVDAEIRAFETAAQSRLGRAAVIDDLRETLFAALFASYRCYRPIIDADRRARAAGRPGSKTYESRFTADTRALTIAQLGDAATMLGSIWLTSWRAAEAAKASGGRGSGRAVSRPTRTSR